MLCVCSTALSEFLCPLLRPHHFVVAGIVCHTCLSARTFLCKFVTVKRGILNRAASQQISARQKQSAANERRSQHDNVRRPSLEVSTPPSDIHTPCHSDLSSTGSLRCDQCASRNSHSMLRIAHARLCPQHRPAHAYSNPPSQAVTIVHLEGLEPSSVLSQLLYMLLRATIRTLNRKSANRCSRAQYVNSEGSTNCMPTRDVRWSKFAGTGKERNAFPFKKDLSRSHFFFVFSLSYNGSFLSFLSFLGLVIPFFTVLFQFFHLSIFLNPFLVF